MCLLCRSHWQTKNWQKKWRTLKGLWRTWAPLLSISLNADMVFHTGRELPCEVVCDDLTSAALQTLLRFAATLGLFFCFTWASEICYSSLSVLFNGTCPDSVQLRPSCRTEVLLASYSVMSLREYCTVRVISESSAEISAFNRDDLWRTLLCEWILKLFA